MQSIRINWIFKETTDFVFFLSDGLNIQSAAKALPKMPRPIFPFKMDTNLNNFI